MMYTATLAPQAIDELTMVVVKRLLDQKVDHAAITLVIDDMKAWATEAETRAAEHNQQMAEMRATFQPWMKEHA